MPKAKFPIRLASAAALLLALSAPAQTTAPADPHAVIVQGHARFTILTPQLIRMEYSADGTFEDRPSLVFIHRKLPGPTFTHAVSNNELHIHTEALDLTYSGTGRFTADNLNITLAANHITWHPGLPDTGNLQGTARTLDGAAGSKTKAPMDPGILSRDGWTVVDDSTRPLFDSADFSYTSEQSPWPWAIPRPTGPKDDPNQDLYFFGYGHDYKKALGDFVQVAGRIPLPPRFAFGSWWSRFWSYSDQEFNGLVQGFKENDVPLDVLVIDMGWHPTFGFRRDIHDQAGQRKGWTGYTWNSLLFPDPQAFLDGIHQQGIKATLNLHPRGGVQPWEKPYPEMARAMGIDPATQKYVPFDITNKKFALNYMDILHHPFEKQGIDFWWLDWQSEPDTPIPGLNNTWWLNYVHFTDQQREGKRPLLFHRWGGLGNHRYQIGFSGDTISIWDSLAFQPWFTATAANVGYAYWSHDIGGHMPGAVAPELYTRWVQFGAFSPILRTHTTSNPDSERRIWANGEPYADIMRSAFQLRYALQPYLYTEARRTYDTGVAFDHPLYYDYPESPEAYTVRNEYAFGQNMIVAPVTKPVDETTQLATEDVWIPKGEWIEWPTGKHFTGPQTVTRSFSISQIPIYLPAGAILPMMPKMEYTGQKPVDPLIVNVFPPKDAQTSTYTLYEDSGVAVQYQKGVAAWTGLSATTHGPDTTLTLHPAKGSYPGMPTHRALELRLPDAWPPSSVTVDGQPLAWTKEPAKHPGAPGWHFDGNTLTTIVSIPSHPVTATVTVKVHRDPTRQNAQLNAFPGDVTRYLEASDAVNHSGQGVWAPDSLIQIAQTGDRLTYDPKSAPEEIAALPARYATALADVKKLLTDYQSGHLPDALNPMKDSATPEADREHHIQYLTRAIALLEDAKPPTP
jgi:alpha-glucosidase (family GH31 glycosyl hydrolase)